MWPWAPGPAARLLTGFQLGLESKRPSREELARAAHEDPSLVATREDLSRNLFGNLCRCAGYESQLRAIVRYLREDGVAVGFKMPAIEEGALSETEGSTHISTRALGIPQSQVQVIKPRTGGGFGAKQSGCCEVFAAFVALKMGRPAKCLYTREETFASSNSRHQMAMHVRVGARKDGSITVIDLYALSNAGAYGEHASTTIGLVGHKTLPIYGRAAASRFTYDVVYTNTMRGGAYRGYGATQGCFAVESAVNELADRLGIDHIDLRRRNLVQAGEVMPQYYNEPLRSCKLDECLVRARQMIGWDEKDMVRDLGDRVRGLGVAVTM